MGEGKEKRTKEKKSENRKEARRKGRKKDRKVGKKTSQKRKREILKGIKEVIGTGTTGREYRIWEGMQGGMQV
jgi:hypothetical protein